MNGIKLNVVSKMTFNTMIVLTMIGFWRLLPSFLMSYGIERLYIARSFAKYFKEMKKEINGMFQHNWKGL